MVLCVLEKPEEPESGLGRILASTLIPSLGSPLSSLHFGSWWPLSSHLVSLSQRLEKVVSQTDLGSPGYTLNLMRPYLSPGPTPALPSWLRHIGSRDPRSGEMSWQVLQVMLVLRNVSGPRGHSIQTVTRQTGGSLLGTEMGESHVRPRDH